MGRRGCCGRLWKIPLSHDTQHPWCQQGDLAELINSDVILDPLEFDFYTLPEEKGEQGTLGSRSSGDIRLPRCPSLLHKMAKCSQPSARLSLRLWKLHPPGLMLCRFHFSFVAQTIKNLPAMQETWVRSPPWEDPLEKGMATHSSVLLWKEFSHGKSYEQRSLEGCSPWGSERVVLSAPCSVLGLFIDPLVNLLCC